MWNSLVEGLGAVLAFFYGLIPNYGVAIILLTVAVRLGLYPLTAKQARAQAKMQGIQPELRKLQQKHKGNKQKLSEETMKLYRENRVNPLGGCLPLLLQMPIFIALYQVLRSPHTRVPGNSGLYAAFGGEETVRSCDPAGLGFAGMDLAKSLNGVWSNVVEAIPYAVLVSLVVFVGVLQGRQSMAASPNQSNQQAKIMGRIFPIMFGFISISLPSGIVLYFLVSSTWQVAQQQVVSRKLGVAKSILGTRPDGSGTPVESARALLGRLSPGAAAKETPSTSKNGGGSSQARKTPVRPESQTGEPPVRKPGTSSRPSQGAGAKSRGKRRRA